MQVIKRKQKLLNRNWRTQNTGEKGNITTKKYLPEKNVYLWYYKENTDVAWERIIFIVTLNKFVQAIVARRYKLSTVQFDFKPVRSCWYHQLIDNVKCIWHGVFIFFLLSTTARLNSCIVVQH